MKTEIYLWSKERGEYLLWKTLKAVGREQAFTGFRLNKIVQLTSELCMIFVEVSK